MNVLIRDFIALKQWLGVGKVDLLGYSFGGELALEIASHIPSDIHKIVLSGPSLMKTEIQRMVQLTGFLSVAEDEMYHKLSPVYKQGLSIGEMYEKVWNLVDADTVDRLLFQDQKIARRNRDMWERSKLENTGLMMEALNREPQLIPLEQRLDRVTQPTLILTGIHDRNTGVPISTMIHRNLAASKLVLFENSAHFPDLEETKKFTEEIHQFLTGENEGDGL
ncbi:hypothetical protein KH172YL63_23250 [Bacillus sp. KH172YL63]|nr:hypothetical protein KH172YL63_23250 [Bacillus sp. KH172YL63]